nr:MAG TPA: hypothetical protein [Caudoviricetes sp.]DAI68848.1 MAG TPA: hypothetical protein [Caudoviricetes sp.]
MKWEDDPISIKSFIDGIKIVKSEDEENLWNKQNLIV